MGMYRSCNLNTCFSDSHFMSQEYQGSQVLRDISFLLGLFQEVTSSLQEIDAQRRPSQKVSHISDCD